MDASSPTRTDESSLGYEGWRIVAVCFLLATFGWGLGFYGQSVYVAELHKQHGWPASLVSSGTTFFYLFGAALVAFVSEAIKAFDKARSGGGPSLIECLTYRHSGHSRADPAKYRPEGELERWKERDPIKIYKERLKQFGVSDAQIDKIVNGVKAMVDEATEKCKAAPNPPMDILTTDVYADGGFAWRN